MALTERQKDILQSLKTYKKLSVKALADELFVSEATIRRDLSEMQTMGLIERSHGGAILPENAEEVSIFLRMERNASEKERVATKAILHIPPFKSVFIDSSSTALALAERIDLSHKTVVTNNLQTAIQLSKKKNVAVNLLGGPLIKENLSTASSLSSVYFADNNFELAIISASAFTPENGFSCGSQMEADLFRIIRKKAKFTYMMLDSSKIGKIKPYTFARAEDINVLITDEAFPAALKESFKAMNIVVL